MINSDDRGCRFVKSSGNSLGRCFDNKLRQLKHLTQGELIVSPGPRVCHKQFRDNRTITKAEVGTFLTFRISRTKEKARRLSLRAISGLAISLVTVASAGPPILAVEPVPVSWDKPVVAN